VLVNAPLVPGAAARSRIRELAEFGHFTEARSEWTSLRGNLGEDLDPDVRKQVAYAGRELLVRLWNRGQHRLALKTADEVISAFENDRDPNIRATIVLAMMSRSLILQRRLRLVAHFRANGRIARFIGDDPEPEVIAAVRMHRQGDRILRIAKHYNS
jgi:hypothetical protein